MKKLFLLVTTGILLLSCRGGDDTTVIDDNSSKVTLEGTWFYNRYILKNGKDGSVLISSTGGPCLSKTNQTFSSNGNFILRRFESPTGSCQSQPIQYGTYSYNENTKELSVILSNELHKMVINDLTHKEVEIQYKSTTDYNGDGILDIRIEIYKKL